MGSQRSTQPVEKKTKAKNKAKKNKTYKQPRLIEYGDIQQLTQAVGNMGMMDGGSVMGAKKTSA